MNFEWAHLIIAALGALCGAGGAIFVGGWRAGRAEGRLMLSFQTAISESETKIEEKVDLARESFDETLKGLRQKINDVELNSERSFVAKGDFDDFRKEYREDMRDLKSSIAGLKQ